MHELSIAQGIVEIVEETVRDRPGARVEKVFVRIGRAVAIVPESLDFCYSAITEGTELARSRLIVEEVPIRVRCRECAREFDVDSFVFRCQDCGGSSLETLSGHELLVTQIEVE